MYGTGLDFWLELLFILAIILLLLISFNAMMRKLLQVEKRKNFSHNHVNKKHSKIDWTIRIIFIVLMFIGLLVNASRSPLDAILFFEPWFLLVAIIFVTEIIRAVMEWKYAENRNAYKLTFFQLLFIFIVLFTLYSTSFFGRI